MFTPRILTRASFTLADIGIELCAHEWQPTPAYNALVHAEWRRMVARSAEPLWDGLYYRVLNLDELEKGAAPATLRLGAVRYRHIATFPALHDHHARLHLDPFNHLSTGALIRTSDGFYLFGRRARNGATEIIGGGVQSDELVVASGADLERNLYKELREEVGITRPDIHALSGIGILYAATSNVIVIAHAAVGLSRAAAENRFLARTEPEMAAPVFVPEHDLRAALHSMAGYRTLIPELL